jgi:hypothetical protein
MDSGSAESRRRHVLGAGGEGNLTVLRRPSRACHTRAASSSAPEAAEASLRVAALSTSRSGVWWSAPRTRNLDVVPVLLGQASGCSDGVESFGFEPVEVPHSPLATHIRCRRLRSARARAALGTRGYLALRKPSHGPKRLEGRNFVGAAEHQLQRARVSAASGYFIRSARSAPASRAAIWARGEGRRTHWLH